MIANRLKFAVAAALAAGSSTIATNAPYGTNTSKAIYDYVIIGSGPGGGPLAANLAKEGHPVFLIEAGGDNHTDIHQEVPALARTAAETPGHSWQFFVDHYQDFEAARRDPKYTYIQTNGSYYVGLDPPEGARPAGLYYPRGSTLGGSAQVNAMNFIWSPDNEWDYIANLTGDDSWDHRHMRRHLKDLENCTYVSEGTLGHGFEGYVVNSFSNASIHLDQPNIANMYRQMFMETEGIHVEDTDDMAELLLRDLNGFDPHRYENGMLFSTPSAIDPSTAARSGAGIYINQVIDAGHPLTVSFHSLATRVLTKKLGNSTKPHAYGVEYMVGEGLYSADGRYDPEQKGEIKEVYARHEVIVSGGTFNTPQILMLSGIGPKEELEKWDIPVVVDLPAVGSNLCDNYEVPLQIRAEEDWLERTESPCTNTFDNEDPCFIQWRDHQAGPYAARDSGYGAIWRSSKSWDKDADIMYLSGPGASGLAGFYPGYSQGLNPEGVNEWFHAVVKMQTTNSAGTVRLNSTDPRIRPNIQFNYFAQDADRDLNALVEGIEMLLRAFDGTGIPYEVLNPDPNNMKQGIKDYTFSHHASSTCRLGPDGDQSACVDSRFRVRGVDKLRVVDASVFPRSPGGMPNGPTWTISRKAFQTLLKDNHSA
ncbi:hypothetical protein F53441_13848 [Fusarium austroafricanum]|uniref:Glucose-methanol-choline oxidoreductase N-terminal domain-containing protein n=1 Tax=Fusarium austroafricanum TaxID=2364996 RepID=A0A8H4NI03_9HYPO|nr:hypothetical protein F53441_13848 [Fusarium austroafricanum]